MDIARLEALEREIAQLIQAFIRIKEQVYEQTNVIITTVYPYSKPPPTQW